MTDQPIYVDQEIFLGRIEEQERFREALRSLRASRKDDDLPFVFLLYGEGGMGKTKLARRLRDIAVDEFKGRFQAIWLDWEKRKPLDMRLAARDAVSPETVFEHLYAVFRDEGFGREFDPYEKAVKSRAETETKVAQALSATVGEGGDRYSGLRELGGKGLAWLVRTGLPGGAAIPEEPTARLFESIIGGGAEGLARAREAATTLLRSKLNPDEFDLFTLPNETLARCLADGIRAAARKKPLLLVLDTYEITDRADMWLRVVIKWAGPRVIWVITGRDNLADSRKYGPTYFTGYRADFPGYRLRVFPLAEFSLDDVAGYFAWRVPDRPLDGVGVAAIHRATLGIPLAVKEAAAIWETGVSLADIVESVPPRAPREQIVRVMTERCLVHCWDTPEDKAQVYALALAHRPDPGLLVAMLDTRTLERDLSDLARRYSFVFVEAMQLHEAVAAFLREYLLAPVRWASGEVRRAHERAVKYLAARQEARQAALPTLEERVADERWATAVLGLVYHSFWLDEERGWEVLLLALVGGLAYDRAFARALLETAEPLVGTFTQTGARRLKVLQAGLSSFPDVEEKAALLAELEAAARRGWPDDGCGDERVAVLALRRGQLLHRRERYKEALAEYERAEKKLPPHGEGLRWQLGEAFYEVSGTFMWPDRSQGSVHSPDGLQAAEKAAFFVPNKAGAHYRLGVAYDNASRYDDAIAEFQRAIELDPQFVYPHNGLGNVYRDLGRHEEAVAAYQRAIELDPQFVYPHNGLGNVYRDLGRHEEAVAAYQRAIELDPQFVYPHNGLGNVYLDLGRHEEAMAEYQRAIELNPRDAAPHNDLGNVYQILGQHEEAMAEYQRAIELNPRDAAPHNNLGNLYASMGCHGEAVTEFQQALELGGLSNHRQAVVRHGLGNVYRELGRHEEAVAEFQRAIELDPGFAEAYSDLADTYTDLGQYDQAIDLYQKSAELRPRVKPHSGLGNVYRELGRYEEAMAEYRRAIELDSKLAAPRNGLGNVYAALGRHEEAVAEFQRALELDPKLTPAYFNWALAEVQRNNVDVALEQLRRAIALEPEEAIERAKKASDFDSIRHDPRFQELVGGRSDTGNQEGER